MSHLYAQSFKHTFLFLDTFDVIIFTITLVCKKNFFVAWIKLCDLYSLFTLN